MPLGGALGNAEICHYQAYPEGRTGWREVAKGSQSEVSKGSQRRQRSKWWRRGLGVLGGLAIPRWRCLRGGVAIYPSVYIYNHASASCAMPYPKRDPNSWRLGALCLLRGDFAIRERRYHHVARTRWARRVCPGLCLADSPRLRAVSVCQSLP